MQKTAVITGGNSGIGFVTARELTRLGWRVIITGRDAGKLRAAAGEIGADFQVADFAARWNQENGAQPAKSRPQAAG